MLVKQGGVGWGRDDYIVGGGCDSETARLPLELLADALLKTAAGVLGFEPFQKIQVLSDEGRHLKPQRQWPPGSTLIFK